jgi:hypothetical protein
MNMNETVGIIFVSIVGFIIGLFIMRFVYQWIFRVNEILDIQVQILKELKKMNGEKGEESKGSFESLWSRKSEGEKK